jgi:hypothetical protein
MASSSPICSRFPAGCSIRGAVTQTRERRESKPTLKAPGRHTRTHPSPRGDKGSGCRSTGPAEAASAIEGKTLPETSQRDADLGAIKIGQGLETTSVLLAWKIGRRAMHRRMRRAFSP